MQLNKIMLGDSRQILKTLPDESIDICVTSPPYKDCDGYTSILMIDVFQEVYRVLKKDSLFFLNFGHLAEDKFRPFSACVMAMNRGFHLNETITWVKNHYRPIQGKKRLNNLSEFVFFYIKGTCLTLIGWPLVFLTPIKATPKDLLVASI